MHARTSTVARSFKKEGLCCERCEWGALLTIHVPSWVVLAEIIVSSGRTDADYDVGCEAFVSEMYNTSI